MSTKSGWWSDAISWLSTRTDLTRDASIGADEAMIELPFLRLPVDFRTWVWRRVGSVPGGDRRVDEVVKIGRAADDRIVAGDTVYSALPGSRVEIAHPDRGQRAFRLRLVVRPVAGGSSSIAAPRAAFERNAAMTFEQEIDLFQPLLDADVGKMQRQEADRPAWRADQAFERRVLRVQRRDGAAHRQEVQPRPGDRQARQKHGSELPAAVDDAAVAIAKARVHVEGRAVDPIMIGQKPTEDFWLVVLVACVSRSARPPAAR